MQFPPEQLKVQLADPVQVCWQPPPSQVDVQLDRSLQLCSQSPFLQEKSQLSLPEQVQLDPEQALSSPPQEERVAKKSTPADLSLSRSAMEEAMAAQHRAMEAEIRRRTAQPEPSGEPESPMQRYSRLLDEGYEHLREKRYESALAAWQEAARLDPENRTLQLNLEILRKKMQSASNPAF